MLTLVLVYIAGVLVKWGWEAADYVGEHRAGGFIGWWQDQQVELVKKAFMHCFLCPGWLTGLIVQMVAGGVALATGAESIPAESIPVIPATTIMAAFMLDSLGKPLMRKLKRRGLDGE